MANSACELGKTGTAVPTSKGNGEVSTAISPIAQKRTTTSSAILPRQTHAPLPATGYLRLKQIIGDPKATPPIPALIPVSKSTWWEGVRTGRFPKPVKPFGPGITVWRIEDIRALIERG